MLGVFCQTVGIDIISLGVWMGVAALKVVVVVAIATATLALEVVVVVAIATLKVVVAVVMGSEVWLSAHGLSVWLKVGQVTEIFSEGSISDMMLEIREEISCPFFLILLK
jgi:hypothetical protein